MITGTVRRDLPAGSVTFLFTDVEGSTKLLHELGAEAYAEKLAEHRRVVREACTAQGGVEVDTQGDAFFMAFPTAQGAIEAARTITDELAPGPIALRIGLHTGSPLLTEEGYVGEDVHFAARVAASAHGGQVVLSQATRTPLDERYALVELGEHRLKDIPEPVAIYQLGDGQFPPLKTISNTNLPRPASSFVGRERELQDVLARIQDGARLLTLTGPGGSGKTRLALEAAASLVPEYKAGVFWVGFASLRDYALVTETMAQTLGAKDGLAEHIGERNMLLLLDNLEQVIEAAPELSSLLQRCPNLVLLVTSRELLRVQGEIEYPVPTLAEAEAVSLFCERAHTAAAEEIAELCQRLDNLPLAVELAAARARALSPAQILERLARRLDLLRAGRDADPRQQTLRATIQWSHDLLSAEEQRLFARLSVFAGGCTLEAAEHVCEADLDALEGLLDKSLLRQEKRAESEPRFWMLETIREYALERLEASGEAEDLRSRHAGYFGALAEEAAPQLRGPKHAPWLGRLRAERANFGEALAWLHERAQAADEMRLASDLAEFAFLDGTLTEARRWLGAALAQPVEHADNLRARALAFAAMNAGFQGDLSEAAPYAEEGLALARKCDEPPVLAEALRALAVVRRFQGDDHASERLNLEALDLAREHHLDPLLADLANNLADSALAAGDLLRAESLLAESIAVARKRNDVVVIAVASSNLATVAYKRAKFSEAARYWADALVLARRSSLVPTVASSLAGIAALMAEAGDYEKSARAYGTVEELTRRTGEPLQEVERELTEHALNAIRVALGEDAKEAAVASGRSTDPAELAAQALEWLERRYQLAHPALAITEPLER
jgi:predicted ATPase/class 3 adenylate cyclase